MVDFDLKCGCCNIALVSVTNANLGMWRFHVNDERIANILCPACGCAHDPVDGITQINMLNVASPRIDSINVNTGSVTGGTTVIVTGHALSNATVTFDGTAGINPRAQSNNSLTVDTPPARIKFVFQGSIQRKMTISGATGTWLAGAVVKGANNETAFIGSLDSASPQHGYDFILGPENLLPANS